MSGIDSGTFKENKLPARNSKRFFGVGNSRSDFGRNDEKAHVEIKKSRRYFILENLFGIFQAL
jgi:hypothetical protein